MEEISKTITYDNLGSIDIQEKINEFLVNSPMESEHFIQEIKIHRSELGYPQMTVKTISYKSL